MPPRTRSGQGQAAPADPPPPQGDPAATGAASAAAPQSVAARVHQRVAQVKRRDFEGKEGLTEQLNLVHTAATEVATAIDGLAGDNATEDSTSAALAALEQGEHSCTV